MKRVKHIILLAVAGLSLSAGLAACGKNSNDNNTLQVGALTSDGNNVSANITLSGGYAVSVAINNIQAYNGGCYNSGWGQQCNNVLNFTAVANNQSTQVQTQPVFVGSNPQDNRRSANAGNLQVIYQAKCYDQACANIAIEVIFGDGYAYRQMVLKRDMAAGKITAMRDNQVTAQTVQSLSTIMQTL